MDVEGGFDHLDMVVMADLLFARGGPWEYI